VTIQLAALETSEPRLLQDTYKQNGSDNSFEEKLRAEKDRLGLLFSPFAQINLFFYSPLELTFTQTTPEKETTADKVYEQSAHNSELPTPNSELNKSPASRASTEIFEAAGLRPSNRQFIQDLLFKSGRPAALQSGLPGRETPTEVRPPVTDRPAVRTNRPGQK